MTWSDAIVAADAGDLKPLIALLRSGKPPPAVVRDWLAELLSGYRPPTEPELRVLEATLEYRELYLRPPRLRRKSDLSFEDAIKRLARQTQLQPAAVAPLRQRLGQGSARLPQAAGPTIVSSRQGRRQAVGVTPL